MNITADIIRRVKSNQLSFYDPCIICGVNFQSCPHDPNDTEAVFKQVKGMSKAKIEQILKGEHGQADRATDA